MDNDDLSWYDASNVYFQTIAQKSLEAELIFSKIGAVLNVLHLIVLTRKSMMTSSINVILIGIACCDLFLMVFMINSSSLDLFFSGSDCIPPPSLDRLRFEWLVISIYTGVRQCSAWLAVLISILNYLIISNITNSNSKFAKLSYGMKAIAATLLMSLIVASAFFLNYEFVEVAKWRPKASCEHYSRDWEESVYSAHYIEFFEIHDGLFLQIRLVFEGVVIKLIPCIMLPTLSGILIYKIRKTTRRWESSPAVVAWKDPRKSHTDRTTIIVIFISISFFLSEFPTGFFDIFEAIFHKEPAAQTLSQTVKFVCDAIFIFNSSLHCLVYFLMSVQYRNTVYSLLRLSYFKKKSGTSVQSVVRLSNTTQHR